MQANAEGLTLNKAELRALLAIASKEETDRDRYGVMFKVENEKCFARASNGRMCVEAHGDALNEVQQENGEWFVHREFLIAAKKLLTGKRVARLEFRGASLHDAAVLENGKEIERLQWEKDAAIAQVEFPNVEKEVKLPPKSRSIAICYAVGAEYLSQLQKIADAADVEFVDTYPPKDADAAVVFRAGAESATIWTGCILPVSSQAVHDAENGDGEDGDPKPKKSRRGRGNSRQQEIAAAE